MRSINFLLTYLLTSLQTDNHASTSSLNFYVPDARPDAQPTVPKHWRPKNMAGFSQKNFFRGGVGRLLSRINFGSDSAQILDIVNIIILPDAQHYVRTRSVAKFSVLDNSHIIDSRVQRNFWSDSTTSTPKPFYGRFSGTIWVSRCHKRTSGLYGARED